MLFYDKRFAYAAKTDDTIKRLTEIEGIGYLTASALVAATGDGRQFKNGREMAAWLGLVPKQYSSGGKAKLGGISKRGDKYLRTLLIHGARSAIAASTHKEDRRSRWVQGLRDRRNKNIAAVAFANRNARIAWAILSTEESYRGAACR